MRRGLSILVLVLAVSAAAYADNYSNAVLGISPDVYWRMNEAAPTPGADAVNIGTLGSAANAKWGYVDQAKSLPETIVGPSAANGFLGLASTNQAAFLNNPVTSDTELQNYHKFDMAGASYMNNDVQTYAFFFQHAGDAQGDGERLIVNSPTLTNDFRVILAGTQMIITAGEAAGSAGSYRAASVADYSFRSGGDLWQHVVIVRNGDDPADADVYINGVAYAMNASTSGGYSKSTAANIGARHAAYNGWGNYMGNVDEVAIWSRALTAQEAGDLYNAAVTVPEPATMVLLSIGGLALLRRRK